ncbi:MAG: TraB/GumN family protein [Candidatus Eutrophobiaceae bacterium]
MKATIVGAILFLAVCVLSIILQVEEAKAADVDSPLCRTDYSSIVDQDKDYPPVPYGKGLLWKISKYGHSSHLFGTIHVSDPDIKQLALEVENAFNQSRGLYLETPFDSELIQAVALLMGNTDPTWMPQTYLDAPLYQRAAKLLAGRGVPTQAMNQLKPWALYLILSYPHSEDPIILDMHLHQLGERSSISIKGLEEGMDVLGIFDDMDKEEQVMLLVDMVCYYSDVEMEFEMMKAAYRQRNPGKIYSMIIDALQEMEDDDAGRLYRKLIDKVLTQRNSSMAHAMDSAVGSSSAGALFFAVGAAHLPGDDGILALLAEKGYEIERVW